MSERFSPPDYGLDLLADLVSDSHRGSVYQRGWYSGRWNLFFGASQDRGFHVVTQGTVHVRTPEATYELGPGDVILLSVPHELATDLSLPARPFEPGLVPAAETGDTCLLCGAYQFEAPEQHPVFANLPPVILLRMGERDPAVDGLIAVLDREFQTHAPGGRAIATRLIDAMLIYIIRHWMESDCPTAMTWLRGLRDPVLARALVAIHNRYQESWTLERLARAAGTSRATLIRGFNTDIGMTPTQLLTERRIAAAAHLLTSTTQSLDEIAAAVGYASAFSLSKAFKRERGLSPSAWRAPSAPKGSVAVHRRSL